MDIGELRGLLTLQDNFSKPINDASKELGFFSSSFGAVTGVVGLAAGAITAATGAIVALGTRGAAVADVQSAFEGLSAAAGSSAEVMLGQLRAGTLGTISDMELMQTANKALAAGMITTSDDMRTLAAGAQMVADRTGGDTKEAFDSLTSAMASGRTAALKQLGVFVDSKVAVENYAASIGKSKDQLTDAELAQAKSAATLSALRAQLQQNGPATADFGDNMAKAKVFVQNFTDNLGVAIAQSPVIRAGMQAVGQALGGAFGGSQQQQVQAIAGYVNSFAIGLTYVAQGGTVAATVLVTAWYGIKTAIAAVLTVISAVGGAIVGLVAGIAEMASKIPILGDKVKGFAQGAESARSYMAGLTQALAAETAEAARGALGHSQLQQKIDQAQGAVINIRGAMEAASTSQAKLNTEVKAFGPASGEASKRAVADSAKIRESFAKLQTDIDLIGRTGIDKRLRELDAARLKEIAGLRTLKDMTAAEYDQMVKMITLKYQQEAAAAKLSGDQIGSTRKKLEQDILLAKTSGVTAQLAQIEFEKQGELQSLEILKLKYGESYEAIAKLVKEKYDLQSQAAQGHYATVEQAATAAGFKTREDLEHNLATARETYARMLESGKYTYAQLKAAKEAVTKADDELNGVETKSAMDKYQMISSSASSVLRSMFGNSKAAAIAAAVIDTAAAVVSSFKNAGGWPWGLIPAAAMAAAGAAQISKIRSQGAGFREGTADLGYQDFDRGSVETMHGVEAVVPQHRVGDFAGDVADRLAGRLGAGRVVVQLMLPNGRRLAEAVLPEIPRLLAARGVA